MVFHGSWMVFMVPGRFSWFFCGSRLVFHGSMWVFTVFHYSSWFFMVTGHSKEEVTIFRDRHQNRHTLHHNIYVIIIIIKIIITIIITRMTTTISPWSKHFHLKLFSPRKKICIPRIVPIFRMCANFPNLEIGNFPQYCNCTFSFRNCRISA